MNVQTANSDNKPADLSLIGGLKNTLAGIITVAALLWGADLFRDVGINILTQQFVAGMLAGSLALALLHLPAKRGTVRTHVPWYDCLFALFGFAAGIYLAVTIPNLVDLILMRPKDGVIAGIILIVLTVEALRRTTGWSLPIVIFIFIAYGLFGNYVPDPLTGRASDVQRLAAYLAIDVNGMLGMPIIVACTVIVAFLLFGSLLVATGGGEFLSDLAQALMGRYRGGPAKVAVLASLLFGSVSGSAVANVVATGIITIPWMKRGGYTPAQAGGIEAVASTGGQIVPPVMGASAFLIAEFLQISYAEVLLAALVPALLYYLALFIMVDLSARKANLATASSAELPNALEVLKSGWHYILPFVVMSYALFSLNWEPQMAVVAAIATLIVCGLVFGYKGRRPNLLPILKTVYRTGFDAVDTIIICAGAGIVIGILSISGLGFGLTLTLVQVGRDNLFLLLVVVAVVCIILGMGLPTVGVYVLLAVLIAPAMVKLGVSPIAAHLYVMYFGLLSFLTPPVAVASYAAASIAKADPIATSLQSVLFGWTAYIVPFLFVFSPALILQGNAMEIAIAVVTAIVGVYLISIGVVGYLSRPLGIARRFLFVAAGLSALIPAGALPHGELTDIAGVGIGAVLLALEFARKNAAPASRPV